MAFGHPRCRLVPPAVTPIRISDLTAGLASRDAGLAAFRRDVARYLRASHVATYTSIRHAACACLLELAAGDRLNRTEVIVPAYSSPDFADAIDGAGLSVRSCDVDPTTLAIDAASLDAIAGDDVLALVSVNLLGFGNRMDELLDYCRRHDVFLVEVLGYSLGTEYEGQRLGTFGDCALLNFQEGKPIPVGGGMVTSNREELLVSDDGRGPVASNYARLLGYALLSRPLLYARYREVSAAAERAGLPGVRPSTNPESKGRGEYGPPFATMSGFQGGVARRVFARLDENRRHRARAAHYYAEGLADCEHVERIAPAPGVSNVQYVRYPVLVDDEELRTEIQSALLAEGVQTSTLYGHEIDAERFPGAARLRRELLTLPTHPYTTPADWQRTVDLIERVVSQRVSKVDG